MKKSLLDRLHAARREWRGVHLSEREVRILVQTLEHLPHGRYRDELERVYETRIDATIEPGGARQSAILRCSAEKSEAVGVEQVLRSRYWARVPSACAQS